MQEIQEIVRAAKTAYARFEASNPDPDTRQAVKNAVLFLAADLKSVDDYARQHTATGKVAA